MLDTPANRKIFSSRAKDKMNSGGWRRAWFAFATKNKQRHFVVRGERAETGRISHLNNSGVPCAKLGLPGNYLASEGPLRAAGFETENFDGGDPTNEIK